MMTERTDPVTHSSAEAADSQWRSISPKQVWVEVASSLLLMLFMAALAALNFWVWEGWVQGTILAIAAGVTAVSIAFIPRQVRAIQYSLRSDELLFRRGRLFRREVAVPYGRMQLVDVRQNPVGRMLGLASLKFVTAAVATDVTVPGLPIAEAERLRDELVALAEQRRAGL